MFLNGKNKVTDLWIWLFSKGQLREQEKGRTNGEREWMREQDPQSRWQIRHSERKEISSPEQSRSKGNVTAWFDFYRQNLKALTYL